jgi:hypothetical protein
MNFKQYLEELHNIEVGQAITAHEPTDEASSSVKNPHIVSEINASLIRELSEVILSPEAGIQKIRKVLYRYGFDMPALYEADREGDEVVFDLNQFGMEIDPSFYLYVLYYLTDDGYYDFYAEVADYDTVQELLSDDGEEEAEEEK